MTALAYARSYMQTPAINMVEIVRFSPSDALLPIMECVSNSIISLCQSSLPVKDRLIEVEITRGDSQAQGTLLEQPMRTIKTVTITDNGIGFTEKNFESFKTPHSNVLRDEFGCLGLGRFSVLAAFRKMKIRSNFQVDGDWWYREFDFDALREIKSIANHASEEKINKTVVEVRDLYNEQLIEKTALSLAEIASAVMDHFLIYYLSQTIPQITIYEADGSEPPQNVNQLYSNVAKEREKHFTISDHIFKMYPVRNTRTSNRKLHYVHYCADSRTIGRAKNLGKIDSIFNFPLLTQSSGNTYLDVYVVSDYLNKRKFPTRNGFDIPLNQDESTHGEVSFEDIEKELASRLRDQYSAHVKKAQEISIEDWKKYITASPRFSSLLKDAEVLKSLPANMPDEQKEAYLYGITYKKRKSSDAKLEAFIRKPVTEQGIQEIIDDLKNKNELDRDSLADYMLRRKAVIDLLDKFLEADKDGVFKLECDLHSLIYPMGHTNADTTYDEHNLWLLDERLVTYKFIGSDKKISSFSDLNSRKAPDVAMFNLFDNPIGYGDAAQGDISSLVIFEFKRPGDVAPEMPKNYRWEFSRLTDKYFEDFMYGKKNYRGKPVNVRAETRKYGYIILSDIPKELEEYNRIKGWKKSPFNSFYKIESGNTLHVEAMTFDTLLRAAQQRHNPFFDRLFV